MDYLSQARERFKKDYFATDAAKISIDEVEVGFAQCSLTLEKIHMNAAGSVMGGAIFTLADFAFAVASNAGNPDTVSLTSQITFLSRAKGKRLIAIAKCIKSGRSTCFYNVEVFDDLDSLVASVAINGFVKRV